MARHVATLLLMLLLIASAAGVMPVAGGGCQRDVMPSSLAGELDDDDDDGDFMFFTDDDGDQEPVRPLVPLAEWAPVSPLIGGPFASPDGRARIRSVAETPPTVVHWGTAARPSRPMPGAIYAESPPTPLSRDDTVLLGVSNRALEAAGIAGLPAFDSPCAHNNNNPGAATTVASRTCDANETRLLDIVRGAVECTRPRTEEGEGGFVCLAHRYAGHQFGHFAGQLGDGRAHIIAGAIPADIRAADVHLYQLQLKGSGQTPFSRRGDGRAVLRSSIREFVAAEYLHALGIPTSRALAIVSSRGADRARRDPLYDGGIVDEPCAVVLRAAQSWLRIGSVEAAALVDRSRDGVEAVIRGVENVLPEIHYEAVLHASQRPLMPWPKDDPALPRLRGDHNRWAGAFVRTVAMRTGSTVAHWMAFGFAHGVMNTDNMALTGETIDLGPYGFIEAYDPDGFVPNLSDDDERRYAFARQPGVAAWNVERLVDAVAVALDDEVRIVRGHAHGGRQRPGGDRQERVHGKEEVAEFIRRVAARQYWDSYNRTFARLMATRLGLAAPDGVAVFLELLAASQADYTATLRGLAEVPWFASESTGALRRWGYVLRTSGQHGALLRLWALKDFLRRVDAGAWAAWRRRNAPAVATSFDVARRITALSRANPVYTLRNAMVQGVIAAASTALDRQQPAGSGGGGVDGGLGHLLAVLQRPFDVDEGAEARGWSHRPSDAAQRIRVSCSS